MTARELMVSAAADVAASFRPRNPHESAAMADAMAAVWQAIAAVDKCARAVRETDQHIESWVTLGFKADDPRVVESAAGFSGPRTI